MENTKDSDYCRSPCTKPKPKPKLKFNPKGAGAKATVWKHGVNNSFTPLNVPDVSKDLIYSVGLVIDHMVSMREKYDREFVLQTIGNIFIDYEKCTGAYDNAIEFEYPNVDTGDSYDDNYIKHKYNGFINTRSI